MKRLTIGWLLYALFSLAWPWKGFAARESQPLALEAVASYFPISPQDLRLGAGLAFRPTDPVYLRVDAVQSAVGLTLNHRFVLASTIELSVGVSCFYEVTTREIRPALTLARVLF